MPRWVHLGSIFGLLAHHDRRGAAGAIDWGAWRQVGGVQRVVPRPGGDNHHDYGLLIQTQLREESIHENLLSPGRRTRVRTALIVWVLLADAAVNAPDKKRKYESLKITHLATRTLTWNT